MNEIYMIRHGKTEANERRLYCGRTDLPLSDKGIQELLILNYTVPENTHYRISGMIRTKQTLKLLFGEVMYETDSRFREIDFGNFEMKSYEELKDDPEYQKWITGDNEKNVPPEGESGSMMKKRVLEGFLEISKKEQPVVLITHGGVIAAIMESLYPEKKKNRYEWQPRPGHGYLLKNNGYEEI